jgi:CMP-N,N'-diacetyllegionaminic acid synthase
MRPILALIPARGGSKGLPRKNVLPLAGKPLVAHTIATALDSSTITRTIVSTDDDEIAEAARSHGAEVPFRRPAELAADESLDLEVFRHALEWLAREEGYEPELVVHLRPTNPIRRTERVDEAVREMLADPRADSLRSVSVPAQTPYKMWRRAGAYLAPLVEVAGVHDAHSRPRQSLPEVWWQNGYVDVIRPRTVLELASMSGERVLPFVVQDRFVEIDYADAFAAAEELLRRREAGDDERDPEVKQPA